MEEAIKKAKEGIKRGQSPFGAVIIKNNKIISSAHSTVLKDKDSTAHAEVTAIRKACKKLKTWNLKGCIIFSTCEPCPMCFAACHWARISKIFYGAAIKDAQKAGFNELIISNTVMKEKGKATIKLAPNYMREEAASLFKLWKQKRNKPY
ncbi:nucleoside deaminase [Candidatus Woesearchaeota archaeon]|nr:nucleoside deaminase [Candidatus Woesearchaeota archaeon]